MHLALLKPGFRDGSSVDTVSSFLPTLLKGRKIGWLKILESEDIDLVSRSTFRRNVCSRELSANPGKMSLGRLSRSFD
jgi:hypothetical protein